MRLKFAAAAGRATKRRLELEAEGLHVPAFLIASITSQCNLHCAGCYSRCNHATVDAEPVKQLSTAEWKAIFEEAESLGVKILDEEAFRKLLPEGSLPETPQNDSELTLF